jgi:hypothetical protein
MQPMAAGTSGAAAGTGGSSAPDCTQINALRCSKQASGQRERCSDGTWRPAEPCAANEICAGESMPNPGSCLPTADVCRGRNGRSACDDAGVLYQCGDDGVVRGTMRCGSKDLCAPGLMTGTCAKCVPGEFRCTGATLERCDPAGTGFYENRRCDTAELCQAGMGMGMCVEPMCNAGQKTCMGDLLQECKSDRTGFQRLRMCEPGQCDANAGTCRACMPGQARCVGTMLMTCDSSGMRETSTTCDDRCDVDRCVECVGDETATCGESNMGECVFGTKRCRDGHWSECQGNKDPMPETCNGKDDDCDGTPDNGSDLCPQNQLCMSGKCGCRNNNACPNGQYCSNGSCVMPYVQSCGSCPQGMQCNHGICVPDCSDRCPGAPGFNGMPVCGQDLGAGDGCVLVCMTDELPIPATCPQGLSCRQAGQVSICQK